MSEDSGQPKPRPRPLPRTRLPHPRDKHPEPATPKAPVTDINADNRTPCKLSRAHRPAPSPPSRRSPNSDSSPEGLKTKTGSLPRNTSGSSNSSPLVAMRSEAAKLAAMAAEAEQRVKALSAQDSKEEEVADSGQVVGVKLPTIVTDGQGLHSEGRDVAARDRREVPRHPLPHPPSLQVDTSIQSDEEPTDNVKALSRVSQKPERLVIGHASQSHGHTLGVQYPGYTPTTPPDIDLVGGRLVRFTGGFEVWDTYASEDYDRRNRDSNPLFSAAEFELEKKVDSMDSYIVEIRKDAMVGLGLSVSGTNMASDPNLSNLIMNIYVKAVNEAGPAAKSGQICVGDQIVEVDGHSLVGISAKTAMDIFNATGETVRLQLARDRTAERELTETTDSVSDSELVALRKENESLSHKVFALETMEARIKEELDKAVLRYSAAESKLETINHADRQVEKMQIRCKELEEQIEACESSRAKMETEWQEARAHLTDAYSQVEELNSIKEDAELRIKTLEDLVAELSRKHDDAERDKVQAAADAVDVWEQLQEEQKRVAQMQERISELETRVTENADQDLVTRPCSEDSSEVVQQLRLELEGANGQLNEWAEAYKSMEESRDQTLQELEAVKAALAEETEASKQAEEDVAELDEAVIGERQKAEKLQTQLALVQESLENEWAAKKQLERDHKKILEAERLLRQQAEKDLEELKRKISERGFDENLESEIDTENADGARMYGRELTRAIPPTELLDVSVGKERSRLGSYSRRRRPSRYLLQRYAQEEQEIAEQWKLIKPDEEIDAIQEEEEQEEKEQDEESDLMPTGAQVENSKRSDEVHNKPFLRGAVPLCPVSEAGPFPRVRANTTVARSKRPPPKPTRKSSVPRETTVTADGMEESDEVDGAAFKRSFTVSVPRGKGVKALGALLSQQLPMRPSDLKKRQTSTAVPVPPPRPSTGAKLSQQVVESATTDAPALNETSQNPQTIVEEEQTVVKSSKRHLPELNIPLGPSQQSYSAYGQRTAEVVRSDEGSEEPMMRHAHEPTQEDRSECQEQELSVQDVEVQVEDTGEDTGETPSHSRPQPPTRPLPTLVVPAPPPEAPVVEPVTDTALGSRDSSAGSENTSETSSLSSLGSPPLSFPPGDSTDATLDFSLPIPHRQAKTVLDWGQAEVKKWLEIMKMSQYIPSFQEHGIEGPQLPDVDDALLKAMGVSATHRSVLKKEVKVMRSQLDKHKKMEKKRAEEEAKMERKRAEDEAKIAKKRLKEETKTTKKNK